MASMWWVRSGSRWMLTAAWLALMVVCAGGLRARSHVNDEFNWTNTDDVDVDNEDLLVDRRSLNDLHSSSQEGND